MNILALMLRSFISRRIPHAVFLSQIETRVKHQEYPIRGAVVHVYKQVQWIPVALEKYGIRIPSRKYHSTGYIERRFG